MNTLDNASYEIQYIFTILVNTTNLIGLITAIISVSNFVKIINNKYVRRLYSKN